MFEETTFETPYAFALLLFIPVIWYFHNRRKSVTTSVSSTMLFAELPKTMRQRLAENISILRMLALIFMLIALARPRAVIGKKRDSTKGIAMELVVDRSSSMRQELAYQNKSISRIEMVRQVLANFVLGSSSDKSGNSGRAQDLIGMVTFARYSDTICPLVRNQKAVASFIKNLKLVQVRSEDGTAIGDALMLAASRLHQAEKSLSAQLEQGLTTPIKLQSKVIILLTDGSNNAGNVSPQEAAKKAKEWGVKIYAIAIKAEQRRGLFSMFGQTDNSLLKSLAEYTEGRFFEVKDPDQLQAVYQEIDRLEKTEVELPEFVKGDEKFTTLAVIAAAIFALEWLLSATYLRRQS